MKYQILFALFITFFFSLLSCQSTKNFTHSKSKFDLDLLYRVWDVETITVENGKSISGKEMGDPQYEFTKDGKRIKSFTTPPHSEFVIFTLRNDSIFYESEKPLPPTSIIELTKEKLTLKSEKAEWKLYVKK
jgi:hypothetical protein